MFIKVEGKREACFDVANISVTFEATLIDHCLAV